MARILVLDDSEDIREAMRIVLKDMGHEVEFASNGQEGLDLLGVDPPNPQARLPDLILCDVMMPGIDGFTFTTRLESQERTRRIPVVIVTAKGRTRDVFNLPNVAGFLEKPFGAQVLTNVVEMVLTRPQ